MWASHTRNVSGNVLLLTHHFRSEGKGSQDVISSDVGIGLENHLEGPTIGEPTQNQFHGDAGAFDHGFADQDLRVGSDAFASVHLQYLHVNCFPAGLRNEGMFSGRWRWQMGLPDQRANFGDAFVQMQSQQVVELNFAPPLASCVEDGASRD